MYKEKFLSHTNKKIYITRRICFFGIITIKYNNRKIAIFRLLYLFVHYLHALMMQESLAHEQHRGQEVYRP